MTDVVDVVDVSGNELEVEDPAEDDSECALDPVFVRAVLVDSLDDRGTELLVFTDVVTCCEVFGVADVFTSALFTCVDDC